MARLSETLAQLAQAQRAAAARFAEQPENEDSRLRPLESFGANPGALRALTYVPEATSDRRMPLVVVLHGCTQTATGYDRGGGLVRSCRPARVRRALSRAAARE
ncbi:PHB depolymerase family esterase [Sphingomonas sp. Ant20]|uniref:PHB depolymerase family esterase n=1 Tax=Sphingomonas sp. Ant20 TaxID=104605 RepID=UPI00325FD1CF